MSRDKPWADVILAQMREKARQTARQAADDLETSVRILPEPRKTGELLGSFHATVEVVSPSLLRIHGEFASEEPPNKPVGGWTNEGTGIFGPLGTPIVPVYAPFMRWYNEDGPYAGHWAKKKVRGQRKHIGWWDRWVTNRAPGIVNTAFKRSARGL